MEMNTHPGKSEQTTGGNCPSLPVQSPNGKRFSEVVPHSSPSPGSTNPLEDFPNSSDPFAYTGSSIHHVSGFPNDLDFPSFSPRESQPQNYPFISRSSQGILHFHNTPTDNQLTGLINYKKEDDTDSWSTGQLQELLDFSDGMPLSNGQVGNNTEVTSNDNHVTGTWTEPADNVEHNWNAFLGDNVGHQQERVPQSSYDVVASKTSVQQQLSLPSREVSATANSTSSAQCNKPRMRWTQELHEAFVDAVNQLGGSERATPKCILRQMNIEGLTINHVKSHLGKYRTARVTPKSSEGNSENKTDAAEQVSPVDSKTSITITEALRMQMQVQKQLHEQLEIQRKLQLRIEEQGKYLLQMLESRYKAEKEKSKSGTSKVDNPDLSTLSEAPRENEDDRGAPPPTKHAKTGDSV